MYKIGRVMIFVRDFSNSGAHKLKIAQQVLTLVGAELAPFIWVADVWAGSKYSLCFSAQNAR